ncbi:MAG: hypothetical protein VXB01_16450, partial [Opitutae bacterium]
LSALLNTASSLDHNLTTENISLLSDAANNLADLDKARMNSKHKTALATSEKAKSGILESDKKLQFLYDTIATHTTSGCTKETLITIKRAVSTLSDLDRSQGGKTLERALSSVEGDLGRGFCLSSGYQSLPFKPITQ